MSRPTNCNIRHCLYDLLVEREQQSKVSKFNTSLHLHHQSSGLPARSSCFRFLHIFNAGFSSHIMLGAPKGLEAWQAMEQNHSTSQLRGCTETLAWCYSWICTIANLVPAIASSHARAATIHRSAAIEEPRSTHVGAIDLTA